METLLLGLYCLREPKAVEQLHCANIKALGDAFAYLEHADIVPADVIRQCAARLGEPHPPLKVWPPFRRSPASARAQSPPLPGIVIKVAM